MDATTTNTLLGVSSRRGRSNGELPTTVAAGFKRRISKGRQGKVGDFALLDQALLNENCSVTLG